MSRATKRKHVTKEVEEELRVPTASQTIARLVDSRGNNLHEVVDSSGEGYLVSMPVKFRRNIWVKRGDFVLVEPIAEGDKVKAEIVKILTKDHIKFFRSQDCWPESFDDKEANAVTTQARRDNDDDDDESSDDNRDDLFVNTNRQPLNLDGTSAKSSSSESSDSD